VVPVGWTVGVEMLFYVIFPFLYSRYGSLGQRVALLFFTVTISIIFASAVLPKLLDPQVAAEYQQLSLISHLPTFVVGMLAFSVYQLLHQHQQREHIGIALFSLGVLFLCLLIKNPFLFSAIDAHQTPTLAYGFILVGLGLSPLPILVNKVTQFYGRISYSIYLWHPPVIFLLAPFLHHVYTFDLGRAASLLICYAIVFAAVTALGTASHYLIEVPCLKIGQRIKNAISAPRLEAGLRSPQPIISPPAAQYKHS
jgi:peptidoglycan/LPS O-acetylase OafA/YrhL